MALTPTTLWEAFAGGEWSDEYGALSGVSPEDDYAERVKSFYDVVVGPSFGYEPVSEGGEEFGSAFGDAQGMLSIGAERSAFDEAEREFRTAIGDPYGADDPFSWENISRYKTYGGDVGEAFKMLEGELYQKGETLGGETGADYFTSMETEGEAYTSGLEAQREGLTHGGLTAGVGIASGTSGAVLRSGAGITAAEDILTEAYAESAGLGSAYMEGKKKTQFELETDLNAALTKYLGVIEDEKENWYQGVLADVHMIHGLEAGIGESAFGQAYQTMEDLGISTEGLTYDEEAGYQFREDDPSTPENEGVCGIGEVFNEELGYCDAIKGLDLNEYGELYGTGEGLYASQGCTDSSACNYDSDATIDDGSCMQSDVCGVCGGNNDCLEGLQTTTQPWADPYVPWDVSCPCIAYTPGSPEAEELGWNPPEHVTWDVSFDCNGNPC